MRHNGKKRQKYLRLLDSVKRRIIHPKGQPLLSDTEMSVLLLVARHCFNAANDNLNGYPALYRRNPNPY